LSNGKVRKVFEPFRVRNPDVHGCTNVARAQGRSGIEKGPVDLFPAERARQDAEPRLSSEAGQRSEESAERSPSPPVQSAAIDPCTVNQRKPAFSRLLRYYSSEHVRYRTT